MPKTIWTPARDKRLMKMKAQGASAAEISEALGVSRAAIIGRHARLRGVKFPSQMKRERAARVAAEKREKERRRKAEIAIKQMDRRLAQGVPRGQVFLDALEAGARLREIGEHYGVTRQAIQQVVSLWQMRLAIRAEMRAEARAAQQGQ